jgi:uncharacterized protein
LNTIVRDKALIGMVHLGALPGTPFAKDDLASIQDTAVREAQMLADAGFDGVIVENMNDRPFTHGVKGPEIVSSMTRVLLAVREALDAHERKLILGIQVLSGGNKEALAIAQATGAEFIRVENFVFAHIADEGLLPQAEAGELLRYRRQIGADHIRVCVDVKKKHASHAITADISLPEAAEAAQFFGADALIVTGTATGKPTSPTDVAAVSRVTDLPVMVGSGVTPSSVPELLAYADALIVGSYLKQMGYWENPMELRRCLEIVAAADAVRNQRAGVR